MSLKVFNAYAYNTMLELISQQVNLFNSASQNAIVLRSAQNLGDYSDEALYARISGLVRRRNQYTTGAVGAASIDMLLNTSVKVAAGTPPVTIDPRFWSWINKSPEEAGVIIGKQLGEDTMQDMLNTAIKAAVGAIINTGATVFYDGTAGVCSLGGLNKASALFGDRAQDIACWIMHSKSWHDMLDGAITNTAHLFTFNNIKVMQDGMGRPFIVTDAPDLFVDLATDNYRVVGLVQGGAVVEQNNDFTSNIETVNGDENLKRTYQAEWTYNLGLKGYTWDKTNGGASPSNVALGTGTNWDKTATSIKDTCGIAAKFL